MSQERLSQSVIAVDFSITAMHAPVLPASSGFQVSLLRLNGKSVVSHRNIFTGHRLRVLLRSLKPILRFKGWRDNWGDSHFSCFRDAEKLIGELEEFDPKSYSFRYPVDTTGQNATLPHHFSFNVLAFGEKFDQPLNCFPRE